MKPNFGSVRELQKWIDYMKHHYTYGGYLNGKIIKEEDMDWANYRTIPISIVKEKNVGICWDLVNYEHSFLQELGISHDCYFFLSTNSKDGKAITHTFIIMDFHGDKYWLECAWQKYADVRLIASIETVIKMLQNEYGKNPYDLLLYNPEGLDRGLTSQMYMEKIYNTGTFLKKNSY